MKKEKRDEYSLMNAEYLPEIRRTDIIGKCKYRLPFEDLAGWGRGFVIAAVEMMKAVTLSNSNEGLYRCVFPKGVTGHLAAFKDGSGLLGTIMNASGIAGQARWIPIEGASVALKIQQTT